MSLPIEHHDHRAALEHRPQPNEPVVPRRKQDHEEAGGGDHTRGAPSRAAVFGHPIHPMLIPSDSSTFVTIKRARAHAIIADTSLGMGSEAIWLRRRPTWQGPGAPNEMKSEA
jgi:hypothetical protein